MPAQIPRSVETRKELEDIQQQLIRAWVTRDRSLLERLLAPDWMVTHTEGRMSTREEVLALERAGVDAVLVADGNVGALVGDQPLDV